MNETLDVLPGEGETKTVTSVRVRRECDECGEPAHYKHTFLLSNARRNPASTAYGRDDCTWCEDDCLYVCREHKDLKRPRDGYSWCSTFAAVDRLKHLFLYWKDIK